MATRFEWYRRIEPSQPFESLARGFRAEVGDPLWFLAGQWLMGEHQGENATSPVQVTYRASHVPIENMAGNTDYDPQRTPPEAILESEPDDWWTPGRRIQIGLAASALLPPINAAGQELLLQGLPAPYQRFDGQGYDGLRVYEQRVALGIDGNAIFNDVPVAQPTDDWDPAELVYDGSLICAGRTLRMSRHSGGHVDWYSVDADGPIPAPSQTPDPVEVLATRLRYPGSPHPRWWQIEDAHVDIGGYPPDRTHFATMLLVDLVASHADDWFTFPITTDSGSVVVLHDVMVRDCFGDSYEVTAPADWHLFRVEGLQENALVAWPTVTTPLGGPTIEEVLLGVDEDSNLLIAVERRVDGRDVPTKPRPLPGSITQVSDQIDASARKEYRYAASTEVPDRWHPYEITEINGRRRFVQARFAELDQSPPTLAPEPRARVLADPQATISDPVHQIEPSTIPPLGIRIHRRCMLARRTDGSPILWIQRRRLPLAAPPALSVRFDAASATLG